MKEFSAIFVILCFLAYFATMLLREPHSVGFHFDGNKASLHRAIVRVTREEHSDFLKSMHIGNPNNVVDDQLYVVDDSGLISFYAPWQERISNYLFSYRYRYILYPMKLYDVSPESYTIYPYSGHYIRLGKFNKRYAIERNTVNLLDVNARLTRIDEIDYSLYGLRKVVASDQNELTLEVLSVAKSEMKLLCFDLQDLRVHERVVAIRNIDYLNKRCKETIDFVKSLSLFIKHYK